MSKISLQKYASLLSFGARMHWSVKCSGSFNNETEANSMKSEIDDENNDNSEPSEASDADSEKENG